MGKSTHRWLSVEKALHHVLMSVRPLSQESVPLSMALGRILAKDIRSRLDHPPYRVSSMDGFALNMEGVESYPHIFTIIGETTPGCFFRRRLRQSEAVRIYTGAMVPKDADTVLLQEEACISDNERHLVLHHGLNRHTHMRPRGMDFRQGDRLIKKGTKLTPRHIGLAAAGNHDTLSVYRKPRILLLASGNELHAPGTRSKHIVINSNHPTLHALIDMHGGTVIAAHCLPDSHARISHTLRTALNGKSTAAPDIIVTTGGASVGRHDYIKRCFKDVGIRCLVSKIAMRPGKPFTFGRYGKTRILGFPGNPVSSFVCATVFLIPLLYHLTGRFYDRRSRQAILATPLPANGPRAHYMRAQCYRDETGFVHVKAFSEQDSAQLHTLSLANCLLIRPPNAPCADLGENVDIIGFDMDEY